MALIWNKATFDAQYSVRAWPWGIRNYHRVPALHYHWAVQTPRITQMIDRVFANVPGLQSVSNVAVIGGGFWSPEIIEARVAQVDRAVSVDTSDYIIDNQNISEETEIREWCDNDPVLVAAGYGVGNNFLDVFAGFVGPSTYPAGHAQAGQEVPQGYRGNMDRGALMAPGDIWNYLLHPSGGRTSIAVENEDLSTNASVNAVKGRFQGPINCILSELTLDSFEIADDAGRVSLCDAMENLKPNPGCLILHIIEPNPLETQMPLGDATFWRGWLDDRGYQTQLVTDTHGVWR